MFFLSIWPSSINVGSNFLYFKIKYVDCDNWMQVVMAMSILEKIRSVYLKVFKLNTCLF